MKFYFEIESKKNKSSTQSKQYITFKKLRSINEKHFFLFRHLSHILILLALAISYIACTKITGAHDLFASFIDLPKGLSHMLALFYPTQMSLKYIGEIAHSYLKTLLIAISSTTLASIVALIFAIFSSNLGNESNLLSIIIRIISSIFRNLPLPAHVILFLFSFGQNEFTGWFALFIVSLGALSRIFRELIETTSATSFLALRCIGASYMSAIINGVMPNIEGKFISWLLYSLATNIRDVTLVGILTGSGLGFLFTLFFRSFRYDAASLVLIFLIFTVLAFDLFARKVKNIMEKSEVLEKDLKFRRIFSKCIFLFFFSISLFYLFELGSSHLNFSAMFTSLFKNILAMFFNWKSATHLPYSSIVASCIISLSLAFLSTILSSTIAFLLSILNIKYFFASSIPSIIIDFLSSFIRSVPTIIWTLMFSVCFGVGATSTIIGISIHSIAYLVYAFSMSFNSVDKNILDSLSACGASKLHIFFNALLPCCIKSLISWIFFRFEINFMNAVALGSAAGAGGIGYELFIAGSMEFDIKTVGVISYFLLFISLCLEAVSNKIKKKLQTN